MKASTERRASVRLVIEDDPDNGGLVVSVLSDPPIAFERPEEMSMAQHVAAACIELITRASDAVQYERAG
jgi:hypothetical protein